jgi:hypothetical protein
MECDRAGRIITSYVWRQCIASGNPGEVPILLFLGPM